jgi:hypothetical protein
MFSSFRDWADEKIPVWPSTGGGSRRRGFFIPTTAPTPTPSSSFQYLTVRLCADPHPPIRALAHLLRRQYTHSAHTPMARLLDTSLSFPHHELKGKPRRPRPPVNWLAGPADVACPLLFALEKRGCAAAKQATASPTLIAVSPTAHVRRRQRGLYRHLSVRHSFLSGPALATILHVMATASLSPLDASLKRRLRCLCSLVAAVQQK